MFMSSGLRENIKQIYLVFIDNTKHICYTRNSEIQMTGDFAMAIGERINFFRNLRGMTQKYLGVRVGFPERSADVRLAQYETGTRTPKADMTAALANILDVSPQALSVPDIDSYIGLMHTLFTLEDRYGLKVCECDGEVHLRVDVNHGKDAAELSKSLAAWREQAAKLEAGEISKEEYDRWRYRYPEFDTTGIWAKVPPKQISDWLTEVFNPGK